MFELIFARSKMCWGATALPAAHFLRVCSCTLIGTFYLVRFQIAQWFGCFWSTFRALLPPIRWQWE